MVLDLVINYFDGANAIYKRQNVAEMMKICCDNAFPFQARSQGVRTEVYRNAVV